MSTFARTGIGQRNVIVLTLLTALCCLLSEVTGACTIKDIPTSYTVNENDVVSLHCATEGTEQTKWHKGATELTADCTSKNSAYSVQCKESAGYYNLTYTAAWSNRGVFSCNCLSEATNVVVEVEVGIGPVTTSCMVEGTQSACSDVTLTDSDMLIISATSACTYPNPNFVWVVNQVNISVNSYDVQTETLIADCMGAKTGQKKVRQTFNATWATLGSPELIEVLVQRARAATVLGSVPLVNSLVYGFAAAKIVGLVLGSACAIGGITAGVIGLKRALSKNTVKPKPTDADTETGESMGPEKEMTSVST